MDNHSSWPNVKTKMTVITRFCAVTSEQWNFPNLPAYGSVGEKTL